MQITDIKVFPLGEDKLKAFVSIVFDECFMVNDIKVIQGKDGLFISMPSRRKRSGKFKDIAHPLNNETRSAIESQILARYESVVAGFSDTERAATMAPELGSTAARGSRSEPEPRPAQDAADESAPMPVEGGKTLEEVGETYLKDSFWGT